MMMDLTFLLVYLVSALLFHRGLAALAISLSTEQSSAGPWRCALVPAAINSLIFILTHAASMGMVGNWMMVLPVFYVELRLLMKVRPWLAAGLALTAVICGLGTVLLYRAVLAIVLDLPLYAFNDLLNPEHQWVFLPVVLSFLTSSFLFHRYASSRKLQSLCYLLSGKHQVRFLMASMVLTLLFLAMQAYLYDNYNETAGDLRTKLWSLIACIYISAGYFFALRYALRVSTLYYMSDRNAVMQKDLNQRAMEEEALLETIEVDELTGVLTRQAGEQQLRELQVHRTSACLCMVDLDGLKFVNDNLGHSQGDVYLREAAEAMSRSCRQGRDVVCRYGGDEFLVAFVNTALTDARQRMESVARTLEQRAENLSFPMVLSYGVVSWEPGESWASALARADREMYTMKVAHKRQGSHYVR